MHWFVFPLPTVRRDAMKHHCINPFCLWNFPPDENVNWPTCRFFMTDLWCILVYYKGSGRFELQSSSYIIWQSSLNGLFYVFGYSWCLWPLTVLDDNNWLIWCKAVLFDWTVIRCDGVCDVLAHRLWLDCLVDLDQFVFGLSAALKGNSTRTDVHWFYFYFFPLGIEFFQYFFLFVFFGSQNFFMMKVHICLCLAEFDPTAFRTVVIKAQSCRKLLFFVMNCILVEWPFNVESLQPIKSCDCRMCPRSETFIWTLRDILLSLKGRGLWTGGCRRWRLDLCWTSRCRHDYL